MSRFFSWFRWWRIRKDSQHPVRSSITERLNFYQVGRRR